MEWIDRLNSAVNYIEEHITEEIDYIQVSRIAGCSSYHFQRMFSYMANMALSEYVRNRKMTLAATDLIAGEKVIDIALKYGYDSPTSFNRAFKAIHGVAPSKIKESGVIIKSFLPIRFLITIKGETEMNYRIEKKEAFRIVGISSKLDKDIEKNFQVVPTMWQKAATDGTIMKLAGLMNTEIQGLIGASFCNDSLDCKYCIAVASSLESNEFEEFMVPAMTWAMFKGEGTNISIQELERKIVTEWLPNSGYEYANGPDIELYINPDPSNAIFEVWVPVTRTSKN